MKKEEVIKLVDQMTNGVYVEAYEKRELVLELEVKVRKNLDKFIEANKKLENGLTNEKDLFSIMINKARTLESFMELKYEVEKISEIILSSYKNVAVSLTNNPKINNKNIREGLDYLLIVTKKVEEDCYNPISDRVFNLNEEFEYSSVYGSF